MTPPDFLPTSLLHLGVPRPTEPECASLAMLDTGVPKRINLKIRVRENYLIWVSGCLLQNVQKPANSLLAPSCTTKIRQLLRRFKDHSPATGSPDLKQQRTATVIFERSLIHQQI